MLEEIKRAADYGILFAKYVRPYVANANFSRKAFAPSRS
jgi:hypothetical protein